MSHSGWNGADALGHGMGFMEWSGVWWNGDKYRVGGMGLRWV